MLSSPTNNFTPMSISLPMTTDDEILLGFLASPTTPTTSFDFTFDNSLIDTLPNAEVTTVTTATAMQLNLNYDNLARSDSGSCSSATSIGLSATSDSSTSSPTLYPRVTTLTSTMETMNDGFSLDKRRGKKGGVSKVDKTTARKIKNRESANRSYLKKKAQAEEVSNELLYLRERVRVLEAENGLLKEENDRLKDGELLMEDYIDDASDATKYLPLYKSKQSERTQPSTVKSLAKTLALPIVAVSSTVCYMDNTTDYDDIGGRRLMVEDKHVWGGYVVMCIVMFLAVCVGGWDNEEFKKFRNASSRRINSVLARARRRRVFKKTE
jgi:hypothetical protein